MKHQNTLANATNSVAQNARKVNTFEELKRAFEKAYAERREDCGAELSALARAVANSVLSKCIDPQRKSAQDSEKVSNGGASPRLVALKNGLIADMHLLGETQYCAERESRLVFTADGDIVEEVLDRVARDALRKLMAQTLSDGMDLVQEAALAILEQAEKFAGGENWLDSPYTVRRLAKRVYIRLEDSAQYRDEETSPIRETFATVRRVVSDNAPIVDNSHHLYIDAQTPDELDTIYYRLGKYADIGGYESNAVADYDGSTRSTARYTADIESVRGVDALIQRLALTDRQATIIRLRLRGYGVKAIGTYLGITKQAVQNTLRKIGDKYNKLDK